MADRDEYALRSVLVAEIEAPTSPTSFRASPTASPWAAWLAFPWPTSTPIDGWAGTSPRFICSRDLAITDIAGLLAPDDIDFVNVTLYSEESVHLIEQAMRAGKHVFSQKPFVTDLDLRLHLCGLAEGRDLR